MAAVQKSLEKALFFATFVANVFLGAQYRSAASSFCLILGLGFIAGSVGYATELMLLSLAPYWMNAVATLCCLLLTIPGVLYVKFPHPDAKNLWRGALFWAPAQLFGLSFALEHLANFPNHDLSFAAIIAATAITTLVACSAFLGVEFIVLRLPRRVRDFLQFGRVLLVICFLFLGFRLGIWGPTGTKVIWAAIVVSVVPLVGAVFYRWSQHTISLTACVHMPTVSILGKAKSDMIAIPVISDAHLGASSREGTNRTLEAILLANGSTIRRLPLLFTGDITNEGRLSEWLEFDRILKKFRKNPILLLPGNHDLLFGGEKPFSRVARFLLALLSYLPKDTYCFADGGTPITVRKHLSAYGAPLAAIATYGMRARASRRQRERAFNRNPISDLLRHHKTLYQILDGVYPMWWDHPSGGARIILLNSCNLVSATFFDNAVGRVGNGQLQRLSRVLGASKTRKVIIALHHQVGFPKERSLIRQLPWNETALQWSAFSLLDANAFFNAVQSGQSDRLTIVHGHKHVGYSATWNDKISVVSAPSATLAALAIQEGFPRLFGLYVEKQEFGLFDLTSWIELSAAGKEGQVNSNS